MPTDWSQLVPTRRSLLSRLKHWDDQRSWQDFYDIYGPLIYRAACKAGLTETEAEDVVQETVLAVTTAIHRYRYQPERCAFKTWLHAITRRQVADQFGKRQGKGRVLEPLPNAGVETSAAHNLPDPASHALEETFEREWERTLLEAATERVKRRASPPQFQIFEYHVLQRHSARETMRDLGVSAARVYLAKHRVARLLRHEVAYLRTKHV